MNQKLIQLFWGVGLIVGGGMSLAGTLGYLDGLHPLVWIAFFAALGLVSLATYFLSGVKNWGWLFPAGIFSSLSLLIGLDELGVTGAVVATPLFVALGLPFVVAFFFDRSRNWWALIPAGVMVFLTLVTLLLDRTAGEFVGSSLFFLLALAFLLVYLNGRTRPWAALVAYLLFVLGLMPLLAFARRPELSGVLTLFAVALPFLWAYLFSPARWWAVIPGGVLMLLGAFTAAHLLLDRHLDPALMSSAFLVGLSAIFALVWLRHKRAWAGFAAGLGALLAVASLFDSRSALMFWPLAVIASGVFVLIRALRPRLA